jgi:hypothetical protein
VLDEMLCRWRDPGWIGSEDRQRAFVPMAKEAQTKIHFDLIGRRLSDGAENGQFTIRQCLAVAQAAIDNPRCTVVNDDIYSLTGFAIAPSSPDDRDVVFSYFAGLLESSRNEMIRRAAAGALEEVGLRDFPLTTKQLEFVHRVRAVTDDEEVARSLDMALTAAADREAWRKTRAQPPTRPSH